jgi:Zn-dependent protease with chaperone function
MATSTDTGIWSATGGSLELSAGTRDRQRIERRLGPAGAAAARVARIGMTLSALGLATSLFTVAMLVSTWRVRSGARLHVASVAGVRISYPAANPEAIAVLLLAIAGTGVAVRVLGGAARELRAARRFGRALARAGVADLAGAVVIDDPQPRAFCAGLLRPRIYVTSGAIELLDAQALEVVLLHERHHAWRRDPLRLAAGRVVARALFFLPWLRALHGHELSFAELGADESAVTAAPRNRSALARAMLGFTDASAGGAGVDPLRVDYLVGECPSWRVPVSLCIAPALASGLIITVLVLVGRLADGTASLALPFVSPQPCVIVLALLPAAGAHWVVSRRKPASCLLRDN